SWARPAALGGGDPYRSRALAVVGRGAGNALVVITWIVARTVGSRAGPRPRCRPKPGSVTWWRRSCRVSAWPGALACCHGGCSPQRMVGRAGGQGRRADRDAVPGAGAVPGGQWVPIRQHGGLIGAAHPVPLRTRITGQSVRPPVVTHIHRHGAQSRQGGCG